MKLEIVPEVNAQDKILMENILAVGKILHKCVVRLLTVLNLSNGKGTNEITARLAIYPMTVSRKDPLPNYSDRYDVAGNMV
jgi:hypothetical protein